MKVGDLVKFKNNTPKGQYFIIYSMYEDSRVKCYFLAGTEGKMGAFQENQIEVVSEGR